MVKFNEGSKKISELVKEDGYKNFKLNVRFSELYDIRISEIIDEEDTEQNKPSKSYSILKFNGHIDAEDEAESYTMSLTGYTQGENMNVSVNSGGFKVVKALLIKSGLCTEDNFINVKYVTIEPSDINVINEKLYDYECVLTAEKSKGNFVYTVYNLEFL